MTTHIVNDAIAPEPTMTTRLAISTPAAATCAHCGNLMVGSGVMGPWQLRPCPNRSCRDAHDGAWNLIVRVGSLAISIALERRFAQALITHLADPPDPEELTRIAAAAGSMWRGPIPSGEK